VFGADGAFLAQWGSMGSGNGQFRTPSGIAEAAGYVYVCDYGNNRIQVFTLDGAYRTQWGIGGRANGQLLQPLGLAVDAPGNIYVVDSGNNRIQVFGPLTTPARTTSWGALKARYRP